MEENNSLLDIKDLKIAFKLRQGIVNAVNGVSFNLGKEKSLALLVKAEVVKALLPGRYYELKPPVK